MNYDNKSREELIIEITELQQKYNSLKESHQKSIIAQEQATKMFQDMVDKNPLAIQILDTNGYTTKVNAAHTKLFGVVPPPDYSAFSDPQLEKNGISKHFDRIRAGETTLLPGSYYNPHELDPTIPDKLVYLVSKCFTLDDCHGNPEKIVVIHDDNTDRKRAEEELIESKKMFELVISKIPQFVFWKDRDSVYRGCNENFAKIAGLQSPREIVGKTDYDLPWKKEESDFFVATDRRILQSGIAEYHIVETILQADGKQAWIDTNKVPFLDESGLVIGVVGTYEDITERKRTEQELLKNEALTRIAVENLPIIFYMTDNQGVVKLSIGAGLQSLGLEPNQVVGISAFELYKNSPEITDAIRKALNGETATFEAAEAGASHTNIVSPFLISGKQEGIVGVALDNTERKRIELEIAESEERYKALHNASFGGIVIHDKGVILECNQGLSEMTGYSYNELIGINGLMLIAPSARDLVLTNILDGFEKPYEALGMRSNGQIYPLRLEARNVPYKGRTVRAVEFRDTTESKQAEEALRKSEAIKNKMLSNIGDVVVIIDGTERIQYKSSNITSLFGWDSAELIGKSTWDNVHPDDLLASQQFVKSLLAEPNATGTNELRYKRKDGNYVWTEIKLVNLLHDKDIQGFLGNYHDISQRKKVEQELITAKEKAEESDRLKTAFLQNMSHEIRTPMNAIMGFSSLLVNNYGNKEKLEKFSKIISQRCEDLLEIINDILDISKIESGQLGMNIENCNMCELFTELNLFFAEYQIKIGKQHLNFTMQCLCGKSFSYIQTDKLKLKQILINLIGNAFKFTEQGAINCGCKLEQDYLVFYVSDTGIGIPRDKHDEIFERFSQLQHTVLRNIGGTGLGLSIAKGLIGLLGGKMWLESEPDKGTTFYFSIPYIEAELQQQAQYEIESLKPLGFHGKTILIVEDDRYNAAYLKEILADSRIDFLVADNAKNALEIV
ncbi:MAG: hypothetical protein RIS47_2027, partial [Bacteroidota bacterium]